MPITNMTPNRRLVGLLSMTAIVFTVVYGSGLEKIDYHEPETFNDHKWSVKMLRTRMSFSRCNGKTNGWLLHKDVRLLNDSSEDDKAFIQCWRWQPPVRCPDCNKNGKRRCTNPKCQNGYVSVHSHVLAFPVPVGKHREWLLPQLRTNISDIITDKWEEAAFLERLDYNEECVSLEFSDKDLVYFAARDYNLIELVKIVIECICKDEAVAHWELNTEKAQGGARVRSHREASHNHEYAYI